MLQDHVLSWLNSAPTSRPGSSSGGRSFKKSALRVSVHLTAQDGGVNRGEKLLRLQYGCNVRETARFNKINCL